MNNVVFDSREGRKPHDCPSHTGALSSRRAFTMRTENLLFLTLLFCGSFKACTTDVPPSSFAKKKPLPATVRPPQANVCRHSRLAHHLSSWACRPDGRPFPPCLVGLTFLDVPVKLGRLFFFFSLQSLVTVHRVLRSLDDAHARRSDRMKG